MVFVVVVSRFEKFSERARRVLSLAEEEAHRYNHKEVGPEHLLLGMVRENGGVAARALSNLSLDLSKVRSAVEFIIGRSEKPTEGEIGLTPRAKKVVELAVDEARRMKHTYIGTEHLLIGLLREGGGVATGVLEALGVTLDKVRVEIDRVYKSAPTEDTGHVTSPDEGSSQARLDPPPESEYQIAIIEHVAALINEIANSPDFDSRSVAEITIQLFALRDDLLALEKVTPDLESLDSLRSLIRSITHGAPSMREPILKLLSHPIVAGAVGASFQRFLLS